MTDIELLKPHSEKQHQLITFDGSIAAFGGRRFGKTDGCVQRIYYWMQQDPGLYWWVGLSWRSASLKKAWREVTDIAKAILQIMGLPERNHINNSAHEIKIPGLGEIWFRTAENPASLAGEGIKGAVVDEFSLMSEIVWTEYLEATLLDHNGWVAFTGVPKGNNWASRIWARAKTRVGWLQIHAETYDNPFIDNDAIDEIKSNVSESVFNQEYLAMIVADAGQVFSGVMKCVKDTWQEKPIAGHQYIAGVDVADQLDFTVITVIDVTNMSVCYIRRFNKCGYPALESRIKAVHEKFNCSITTIETNNTGYSVMDHLALQNVAVNGFTTTNATKSAIIQNLQSAFEHSRISIPSHDILITELQAYEGMRSKAGNMVYSAPEGMHDDTVMSLAIAWAGASSSPAFL